MFWDLHIPIIAVIIEIGKDFYFSKKKILIWLVMYQFVFSYIIKETQFLIQIQESFINQIQESFINS